MAEVLELVGQAQKAALALEQKMREDAVAHMKEALDLFVRDGHCAVTLRIKEIPTEAWDLIGIDASLYTTPGGRYYQLKREWLTGSEPMLMVEYEREEDD